MKPQKPLFNCCLEHVGYSNLICKNCNDERTLYEKNLILYKKWDDMK